MTGPVVTGQPVASPVMLLGQAPGAREGEKGQPFAWTAGKTLFKWFAEIGLQEAEFRQRVYMAAVCRCFPGKNPKGGDRVPDRQEIENCSSWMRAEIELIKPRLIVPVGKLAIAQTQTHGPTQGQDQEKPATVGKLDEVVGKQHRVVMFGHELDAIPLPHPSGASTWHRTEPGKSLLAHALALIARHEAFRSIL